jgi:plasmid stabilization system protein ParE
MNYRVVLTAEADRNADKIYGRLLERSPQGAAAWFAAFLEAVDSLTNEPERHPFAPESTHFTTAVRQLIFKTRRGRRYRLLFCVDDAVISVLYVRGPGQAPVTE